MSILEKLGVTNGDDNHSKAASGEYRFQFCPHCGSWIPSSYTVTSPSASSLHDEGEKMTAWCSNCDRVSIVTHTGDADP